MTKEFNLIMAGLSGQGVVMAGRILSTALLADGNNVSIADAPALTHRNATTFTHIRVGEDVYSLRIGEGAADLLLAFEPDGLKVGLLYLKRDGLVVLNDQLIRRGSGVGLVDAFKRSGIASVNVFPASDLAAKELGRLITLNMIMLGAGVATGLIPVRPTTVEDMIHKFSPSSATDLNLEAFRVGMQRYIQQYQGDSQ